MNPKLADGLWRGVSLVVVSALLPLLSTQLGYSEIETSIIEQKTMPVTLISAENESSNKTATSKFTGSTFSLEYPSSWTLAPAEFLPQFPGSESLGIMSNRPPALLIAFSIPDPESSSNMTQEQIEASLDETFPRIVSGIMSGFQSEITQPEEPDFDKYVIDGHRAGFVSFTSTHGQGTEKTAVVGTIVGNNIFVISFNSPADGFDSSLPFFEEIIKTAKIIG